MPGWTHPYFASRPGSWRADMDLAGGGLPLGSGRGAGVGAGVDCVMGKAADDASRRCRARTRSKSAVARSSSARVDRDSVDLPSFSRHGPAYQHHQAAALAAFTAWLVLHGISAPVSALLDAPRLVGRLVYSFGLALFKSRGALYTYICTLTALQTAEPALRYDLAAAWSLAWDWRALEPVVHRLPIPVPLLRAVLSLALLAGWPRFAACAYMAYAGPARIGEVLRSLRRHLVLPADNLFDPPLRAFLHSECPKTAGRGGAAQQHATFRGRGAVALLSHAFGDLPLDAPLWPFSAATFRNRWEHLLRSLLVPPAVSFTPGGLRGAGAVCLYLADTPIHDIMWRMRVTHLRTLSHYLQEVTAATSLRSLPAESRAAIMSSARVLEAVAATVCGAPCPDLFPGPAAALNVGSLVA